MANSKFNLSKGEEKKSSKFNLTKEETVSTQAGNNGKKSKWWLWLILLAVVVVVVILVLNNSSSNGDESTVAEPAGTAVEQPTVTPTEKVQGTDAEVTTVVEEPTTPQVETTPATTTPVAEPAPQPVVNNTPVATLPQGNLEEKAKQVIRGDFGNGVERKNALGSEYDAIQQRVNEMYREGIVN